MHKYPIGLQDFRKIREGGFLYIDKTRLIHTLIESGSYYFLSRPRRFGKSLLLSTIKEIFSGNKELFKGLWIADNWNWEQRHPVIHLKFSQMPYQEVGLKEAINQELDKLAEEFGFKLQSTNIKAKFSELIKKTAANGKVVILIDEYDKPTIDYLDDIPKVEENRSVFKSFYSVLKDADEYIRLLLITGVSRFSKVSIFSDLNNLNDITLHLRYTTLAGITQQELESNFAMEIAQMQISQSNIVQEIKEWYNGYSWDGINRVYNPFSLLNFIDANDFQNYWIDTGTPYFLIKQVRSRPDFTFTDSDMIAGPEALNDLNIGHINPLTLMFQTGYLTIKSYDKENRLYTLGYPNREVKESVLVYLIAAYSYIEPGYVRPNITELKIAFIRNDIAKVIRIIDTLLVDIPNQLWTGAKESFYHGLLHNTFQLLGIQIASEVNSATGRLDASVMTKTHIYIMEFKLDSTAQKALDQIIEKDYLRPYQLDPRKKVAIGINFSSEKKAVNDYLIKDC